MKAVKSIVHKILSQKDLMARLAQWRVLEMKIAFTNGVFDILHPGHIASLAEAAGLADYLVVAVNADASVTRLKGPSRPVNNEQSRALLLASLSIIDAVVIFTEDTPLELIRMVRPDVLVKGGDYKVEDIAGASDVLSWGGKVIINPLVPGLSTTALIEKLKTSG